MYDKNRVDNIEENCQLIPIDQTTKIKHNNSKVRPTIPI